YREPQSIPNDLTGLTPEELREVAWRLRFKACVLAQTLPATLENVVRLATLVQAVHSLPRTRGEGRTCPPEDLARVQALRDCLRTWEGSPTDVPAPSPGRPAMERPAASAAPRCPGTVLPRAAGSVQACPPEAGGHSGREGPGPERCSKNEVTDGLGRPRP